MMRNRYQSTAMAAVSEAVVSGEQSYVEDPQPGMQPFQMKVHCCVEVDKVGDHLSMLAMELKAERLARQNLEFNQERENEVLKTEIHALKQKLAVNTILIMSQLTAYCTRK